jgi:hypothetical protein
MSSLKGIPGETSRTIMWSGFFRSWIGLLLVTGILLFGITGRIQFSCNPMVTGGDLPGFCSSAEIVENVSTRPTHGDSINKIAADPRQDSVTLGKIIDIQEPTVEDNPRIRTYALARNPNTPESTFLRLSGSDDLEVLTGLLSNKSATSNSRVMERLCNNSLVKQKLKTCYSPPPPSCRKNHARNIAVGLGLGLLTFIAAPVLLPAEAVIAPFAAGLLGGASAFGASAGLLELFTKC